MATKKSTPKVKSSRNYTVIGPGLPPEGRVYTDKKMAESLASKVPGRVIK